MSLFKFLKIETIDGIRRSINPSMIIGIEEIRDGQETIIHVINSPARRVNLSMDIIHDMINRCFQP